MEVSRRGAPPAGRRWSARRARRTGGARTSEGCPSQNVEWLFAFASRGAMDIEHLGYKTGYLLSDLGWVDDPADIYSLTAEQLAQLPGFKDKSIAEPPGRDRGVEGPAAVAPAGRAEHPPRGRDRGPGLARAFLPSTRCARRPSRTCAPSRASGRRSPRACSTGSTTNEPAAAGQLAAAGVRMEDTRAGAPSPRAR